MKPDGSALLFMPSQKFQLLSDQDAAALIAYLETLPPVDREPIRNRVGPVGRALYAKGDVALIPAELLDQTSAHPRAVPLGITVEYGRHVADVGGCKGCHGPGLSGGHIPGAPPDWKPAANIVALDRVRELQSLGGGEYRVLLNDGTQVPMSQRYRHRLP